ncbi:MAG: HNH endonuclease [Anaerolineae bacterium]|nr:HNH endonuclease [Anaerolineae bacterium]
MVNVDARTVLLLNASYVPLRPITIRDAVDLIMRDMVDAVDGVAARLNTTTTVFEVPSVLRLRYYVNVPLRGAVWSRRGVLSRDHYTCIYCGATVGDQQRGKTLMRADLTIDHLTPRSRGGENTWSNTACACRWCNHRKADRMPHEAGMKLLWEPKRPRTRYLVINGEVPEEWKVYINL